MENLELIIDKIEPVLINLASELGVASEYLWGILIRQQYLEGIVALGFFFLGIGMLYGGYRLVRLSSENNDDFFGMAGTFLGMFGFIMTIIAFINAVFHLGNPQYQAIQAILEMLIK